MSRKKIIITISVIVFIAALAAASHLLFKNRASKLIQDELQASLDNAYPGFYKIKVKNPELSLFFTRMYIDKISIEPLQENFKDLPPIELPRFIGLIEIQDLEISASAIISIIFSKHKIKVPATRQGNINLKLYLNPNGEKPLSGDAENKLESIMIQQFQVKNLDLEIRELKKPSSVKFLSTGTRISGSIQAELKPEDGSSAKFIPGDLYFKTKNIIYFDRLYEYSADSLFFDSGDLFAFRFKIKPLYNREEFSSLLKWQADRIDMITDFIVLRGIDPNGILNENRFSLSLIKVIGGILDVYRDKNVPFDTSRRPLLPTKLLLNTAPRIEIDQVLLSQVHIFYSELPEKGKSAGIFPFMDLEAEISNITNNRKLIEIDSLMKIKARALFFDQANLNAEFVYNLKDRAGGYFADGQLSEISFGELNPAVLPLTGMELNNGRHHFSSFFFSGNDIKCSGELQMHYSDLEVKVLPDKKILSTPLDFFAKSFVYYQSNPSENQQARTGEINTERDSTRFVFNYWWKSYLSGIKSIMLKNQE